MYEVSEETICKLEEQLLQWQNQHVQQLQQQDDSTLQDSSVEMIMHQLKSRMCDSCHKCNAYKFIKMSSSAKSNSIILVCKQCYYCSQLQTFCRKDYLPMNIVISNTSKQLKSCENYPFWDYLALQKAVKEITTNYFQSVTKPMIKQLCHPLLTQITRLTSLETTSLSTLFAPLIEQPSSQKDCQEVISKVSLLNLHELLKKNNQRQVLEGLLSQVQLKVLKYMHPIQQFIHKLKRQLENLTLNNPEFIQQLITTAQNQQIHEQNNEIFELNSSVLDLKEYQKQSIYKEQLLNYKHITDIKISDHRLSSILARDIITFHQQQSSKRYSREMSGKTLKLLNPQTIINLEHLSINCKFDVSPDFIKALSEFRSLKVLSLPWNSRSNFDHYSQSLAFLECKPALITTATPPMLLLPLSTSLGSLWIANFSEEDPQSPNCFKLLQKHSKTIQSLTLGNLQGKQREIPRTLYPLFPNNLKGLHLNKITFEDTSFISMLKNHSSIESLYFKQFTKISTDCMKGITQLPLLTKLGFDQIGHQINLNTPIPQLKAFLLSRSYWNLNQKLQGFLSKTELEILCLDGCFMGSEKIINQILQHQVQKKSQLKSVYLGQTKASNHTLTILNKITTIRKLNISATKVDIYQFLQQLQKGQLNNLQQIEKLSLKNMNQEFKDCQISHSKSLVFSKIISQFHKITHLNINDNEGLNETVLKDLPNSLVYLNQNNIPRKQSHIESQSTIQSTVVTPLAHK